MSLVKLICGKTLTRLVTGKPGSLEEFFEMVRERGYSVSVSFISEETDITGNLVDLPKIIYSSGNIRYEVPIIDADDLSRFAPDIVPCRENLFEVYLSRQQIFKVLKRQHKSYSSLYKDLSLHFTH